MKLSVLLSPTANLRSATALISVLALAACTAPRPVSTSPSAQIQPMPVGELPSMPIYLVFFDWDKTALNPRALHMIAEAAVTSKSSWGPQVDASGYTDTSGTADYNMSLSKRRAKAVVAQLEADGVPPSEIAIHAYGEARLLVATGPGVREPQNRRVEIMVP